MGARGLVMAVAAEWLLLKLAAERIGAARLLPAWRDGALRSVPSETIVREVMRIGAARLNRASLEGTLPLRGVKHGTDEEIDIPSSVAGRLVLDCGPNCLVRLSSQGRRRLIEYHSVKARLTDVERLEQEAKPPTPQPSRDGKTADAFATSPAAEDTPVIDEQAPQSGSTSETLLPKILQKKGVTQVADMLLTQWSARPASTVGEMQTFVLRKTKQASKTTVERAIRRLEMLGRWGK
jgi:hypothetical protein